MNGKRWGLSANILDVGWYDDQFRVLEASFCQIYPRSPAKTVRVRRVNDVTDGEDSELWNLPCQVVTIKTICRSYQIGWGSDVTQNCKQNHEQLLNDTGMRIPTMC